MAEIKSTLDLVMERTRHLSQSTAEKEAQRRDDFEKRLQGLLQQYADGALTAGRVIERTRTLQAEMSIEDPQLAAGTVIRRVDPDQDNEHWLDLLKTLVPEACASLKEILAGYERRRTGLLKAGEEALRNELDRHHGIAGSAVVPNPLSRPAYQKDLADLRQETRAQIDALSAEET